MSWEFKENQAVCEGKCNQIPTAKKIIIKPEPMKKIKTLLNEFKELEWMAMLQGTETEQEINIEELIIPEQEGTKAHIELTKDGDVEAQKTPNIGWIHSHNSMGVFFSENDKQTASQNRVSIVVNNRLEMKALILDILPCGQKTLNETEIEIIDETPRDTTFIELIKTKIKEVKTKFSYTDTIKYIDKFGEKVQTQTLLTDIDSRPEGMSRKEWKKLKRKERQKTEYERLRDEYEALEEEGPVTGWTGTCHFCLSKVKDYEVAHFVRGQLYHEDCYKMEVKSDEYVYE